MAGLYPDAPHHRMAYDDDGTVLWFADTNADGVVPATYTTGLILPGTERTKAQKEKHNNETSISGSDVVGVGNFIGNPGPHAFFMVFPEQRDIYGINYWCTATFNDPGDPNRRNVPKDVEGSTNTTNGMDGSWSSIFPGTSYPTLTPWHSGITGDVATVYSWDHWYRIGIETTNLPVTNIKAIRWIQERGEGLIGNSSWHHIHVYGTISAGATPDRLLFINENTGLEFTGPIDCAEVPRGASLLHELRMKNNSATLTANNVLLDFEALHGLSDTWHTIKETGGSYAGTLSITSIAPTATYPSGANVITVKTSIALDESLGLNACRLQASTTSWT